MNTYNVKLSHPEVLALVLVVTDQLDIMRDVVTDVITMPYDLSPSSWCREDVAQCKKEVDSRIEILSLLIQLDTLTRLACEQPIQFELNLTSPEMHIINEQIELHLNMLDDMLEEETDRSTSDRVNDIVNINLMWQKFK